MERIGIYGGTFSPPHVGHMRAAQVAVEALRLDRLLLMPAFQSPDKSAPNVAAEHRLAMVRMAAGEKMEVSDLEIARGGISYTVDTLTQIQKLHPDAALFLCMGTDMFLSFESWKDPREIMKLATLAVFYRGERNEKAAVAEQKAHLEAQGARVTLIENPVTAISSTDLRRLLAFHCADSFLPDGVGSYIRENGLYDGNRDFKNLPIDQLTDAVIGLLKPNRVRHTIGCRDTAVALAKHWGANEEDAARAGILHDVTKALDGPLQLTLSEAYGKILNDFSRKHPKTLHALTGSLVAERIFGENKAVVEAIASHTTGKANMTTLQKIIYIADYMEPCRDFPGVEELRQLAYTDLDKALKLGLEMTLQHLARQGSEVSPESRDALRFLNEAGL